MGVAEGLQWGWPGGCGGGGGGECKRAPAGLVVWLEQGRDSLWRSGSPCWGGMQRVGA